MSALLIEAFDSSLEEEWDRFCETATTATFLHTRRFLSYHGDRFQDLSVVIRDTQGNMVAVFPAAVGPGDNTAVVSHPGATYGGIVHQGRLFGTRMLEAIAALRKHYSGQGYQTLIYKPVPSFYQSVPSADDLYALFIDGAELYRRDLSATIDLEHRGVIARRRRCGLAKAAKFGVTVESSPTLLDRLWPVLVDNLSRKHGVRPVHTVEEMAELCRRFPNQITCVAGLRDGRLVAGVIVFSTPMLDHAQYSAASEEGYRVAALDAVFDYCISRAKERGKRYLNFGISTEDEGRILNKGLCRFKHEFGAGGTIHEFYRLSID